MKISKNIYFVSIFTVVVLCAGSVGQANNLATPDRNRFFNCKGNEVQVADSQPKAISGPANAVFQVKGKIVHVNGAWPFTNDDLPIVSEDDIEIKFSRFINVSAFGDAGTFNKVTGKLRLDVTDGLGSEPAKVKVHWWGDYMCKATKKAL